MAQHKGRPNRNNIIADSGVEGEVWRGSQQTVVQLVFALAVVPSAPRVRIYFHGQ